MSYRSDVALKTTTEGFIVLQEINDSIKDKSEQILSDMLIQKSPEGNYRISKVDTEWDEDSPQVNNFYNALNKLKQYSIPYVFIRIGEDFTDVEVKQNWVDVMPKPLVTFAPKISIYDEDEDEYITIR